MPLAVHELGFGSAVGETPQLSVDDWRNLVGTRLHATIASGLLDDLGVVATLRRSNFCSGDQIKILPSLAKMCSTISVALVRRAVGPAFYVAEGVFVEQFGKTQLVVVAGKTATQAQTLLLSSHVCVEYAGAAVCAASSNLVGDVFLTETLQQTRHMMCGQKDYEDEWLTRTGTGPLTDALRTLWQSTETSREVCSLVQKETEAAGECMEGVLVVSPSMRRTSESANLLRTPLW